MINIKHKSSLELSVGAETGGFGNHVRWLALLDPVFQFELTPPIPSRSKKILDISRHINFLDTQNKLRSFSQQIYSPTRSWHNWLWTEWLYREDLNQVLQFDHKFHVFNNVDKNLILTIDPDIALHCYFKLNSCLNYHSPQQFKNKIQTHNFNAQHNNLGRAKKKIYNVDCLYQPTLDREFYNSMIEWFELTDCYDLANQVHGLWFDAHQRAEQGFVEYTNNLYKRIDQHTVI